MRIAVISSDQVFRLGFRALIDASDDLTWSPEVSGRSWGFADVERHRPEVLVVDTSALGVRAAHATREIRLRVPETRVLLLSSWARERDAVDAMAAGGSGLALKTDSASELLDAVRAVGHGRPYVAPAFRGFAALDQAVRAGCEPRETGIHVLGALSRREREVFDLVVSGLGSTEVSERLHISAKTVDTHRTRIQRKLGCRDALDLIRFAAENDLLDGNRRPDRTILLLVDDDPRLRREIMRAALGARPGGPPGPAALEVRSIPTPSLVTVLGKAGHQLAERVAASLPTCSSLTGLLTVVQDGQVAGKSDLDGGIPYRTLPAGHEHDRSGNHPGGR